MVKAKRIYEPAAKSDGIRVLVDRLWPRGVSKESANISEWMKDLAPSHELRRLFHHKPESFEEFRNAYLRELADPQKVDLLQHLVNLAHEGTLTLVYAAKDTEHNNAMVLEEFLTRILRR